MTQAQIVFSPLREAVPASGGTLDLIVRVQAPTRPTEDACLGVAKRLAIVLDRSGSMRGRPIAESLRCVEHIARRLGPQDALSLVVYDDDAKVLMPLRTMHEHGDIAHVLAKVHARGCTNLFSGWQTGAQQLESGLDDTVSRVILLSDGCANEGLTDPTKIFQHCGRWQELGITTTTVGLGRNFNEDLMIGMAASGGGQHYYGQTADDMFDNFDEELSLLQSLMLRRMKLRLLPASGVIVEVLNTVNSTSDGAYCMTDLAWGAESWLAVRLHLNPDVDALGNERALLVAKLDGITSEGHAWSQTSSVYQLPCLAAEQLADIPVNEEVKVRLQEVAFATDVERVRKLIGKVGRRTLEEELDKLHKVYGHHPWLQAKLSQLRELGRRDEALMGKEMAFSSARFYKRLAGIQEDQFAGDETQSTDMPAFLRKKISEGRGRRPAKGPTDPAAG